MTAATKPNTTPDHKILLTVDQVCSMLTISVPTLHRYVKNVERFPQKIRIGPRRVGFRKTDVDAYLERCMGGTN